jgi:hypothetical protein
VVKLKLQICGKHKRKQRGVEGEVHIEADGIAFNKGRNTVGGVGTAAANGVYEYHSEG